MDLFAWFGIAWFEVLQSLGRLAAGSGRRLSVTACHSF
jgi:hypothetical protein